MSDSVAGLSLLVTAETDARALTSPEQEVLQSFDRSAPALLRYVGSLGLNAEEAEDIVQDVFLLLFRHLRLGRSRSNLRGWLFQVAHNQALKRRARLQRRLDGGVWDDVVMARRADPAPGPDVRLVTDERRRLIRSVLHALPERDRRCVFLRAEGLRYREIAQTLGISLGAVAKSLTRSVARFVNAHGAHGASGE